MAARSSTFAGWPTAAAWCGSPAWPRPRGTPSWRPTFGRSADSLRRLDDREHRLLVPLELRVAKARPGETLAALSERARNQWGVGQTAISNGFRETIRFQGGELVKVAVRAASP